VIAYEYNIETPNTHTLVLSGRIQFENRFEHIDEIETIRKIFTSSDKPTVNIEGVFFANSGFIAEFARLVFGISMKSILVIGNENSAWQKKFVRLMQTKNKHIQTEWR